MDSLASALFNVFLGVMLSLILCWVNGKWLVQRWHVKVNYTRKIYHFFITTWALWGFRVTGLAAPDVAAPVFGIVSVLSSLLFLQSLRRRFKILDTMFISLDRPEDRPHTVEWLMWQWLGSLLVITPLLAILQSMGMRALIDVPSWVNGFGDGLAEPVGVRWGKHKYAVRSWGSKPGDAKHTRSLEGSACVFISAVVALLIRRAFFTPVQLVFALLVLPPAMTLAEAWSPHTIDTPFLFLVGGVALLGTLSLPF